MSLFKCWVQRDELFMPFAFLTQVQNMVEKWHIYMTADGRISLAGLPVNKTEYLSDALIDSVKFLVIKGKL